MGGTGTGQPGGGDHRSVAVRTSFGEFDVDAALAELVAMLHGQGIETLYSCQGDDLVLHPSWWRRALVAHRGRRLASRPTGRHLGRATRPLEALEGADERWHGYLMFPGNGARQFYSLLLEATARSGDPRAGLVNTRLRHSLHDADERECTTGFDVGSLCEYLTGRWYFEVVEGYPDPFELRTVVRFPRRDVDLVTVAVRDLLAGRTKSQPRRMP